jgi:Protein of unknown function (DUF2281)
MDAKTFTSVEIPENVVTSLSVLSPDQRQQVFDFVEFLSQKQKVPILTEDVQRGNSKTERVLGLHAGKGWVSNDFELPLPDEFWSMETISSAAQ